MAQETKDFSDLPEKDKDHAITLLMEDKPEEAKAYIQKTMADVHTQKAEEAKDVLTQITPEHIAENVWTPEQLDLAEASNGKIVLRPDGRIDFPEIGIKGAARLTSSAETDFSNPEEALIQGDYVDKNGNTGIPGMTYMTGKRAEKEATAQGLKLFPKYQAKEKTEALYDALGSAGVPVYEACQTLFGKEFSGFWNPDYEKRLNIGSASYLGCSEVSPFGSVRALKGGSAGACLDWDDQFCPRPFLACEHC